MSNMVAGGWTDFDFNITPEAKEVFDSAVKLMGVGYTPLAFATQVVSGKNYCFLTKGKVVYPDAPDFVALIYIYVPLQGPAHITRMKRIEP